jgi:PAS domain S-box-containing protein
MGSFDRIPRLWRNSGDDAGAELQDAALLEALPDAVGIFDAAGRLLGGNGRLRKLFGLTTAQLLDGVDMALLARLARLGQPAGEVPPLQDNDARPGADGRRVLRLVQGRPVQVHAARADARTVLTFTELVAGTAPALPAQHLQRLLELAGDAEGLELAWWDETQACRLANDGFVRSVGRPRAQVLERPLAELLQGERRQLALARLAATLRGEPQRFEERRGGADGSERIFEHHWVPAPDAGGRPGCYAIARDVTVLRAAQDGARRASDARTHFVANVNHELRTPMTTVMGMLELLELSGLEGPQLAQVGRAQSAARHLLHVAETLVEYADLEGGRLRLAPEPFELDRLLREMSAALADGADERGLDLVFDLDPALPAALVGDHRRIRQVLWQLGANALKFTEAGRVTLAVRVVARCSGAIKLAFSVEDTGIGIEPGLLGRLQTDFGQADGAAQRRHGGTGLGLALCRRLLQAMGSRLHAASVPGQGSRFGFTLKLPLAPLEEGTSAGAWRVLVADACEPRRRAHARTARALGWRVAEAATQAEMLELLRSSHHLQAVFVDGSLSSPGAPLAAALAAAAAPGEVAVIATGGPSVRLQWQGLSPLQRVRISACLPRPATGGMLVEAVAQACSASVEQAGGTSAEPLRGLRLLLAEDNASSQLVASELLTGRGAQVDLCVDGLDALTSLVAGGTYDAILMDWQMPNMDGLDATREIRQIHGFEHIPIIALTANGTVADRATCLAAGMDDHVSKPIDVEQLVGVILRHTRPGFSPSRAPGSGASRPAPLAPMAPPAAEFGPSTRAGVSPLELATQLGFAPTERPAPDTEPVFPDLLELPEAAPARPAAAPATARPPALPVLDQAGALRRLGGNETLYRTLAAQVLAAAEVRLDELVQALVQEDRDAARRLAHTLKGNAATVGAEALAEAARALEERLGLPEAEDEERALLAALGAAVRSTLPALQALAEPSRDELAAAIQAQLAA